MARIDELIGYGTHADRPAAGSAGSLYYETDTDTLFRDNGTTWDTLTLGSGGTSTILLDYVATTDLHDGSALPANTWTDVGTNQTFTPASASSLIEIVITGFIYAAANTGGSRVRTRAYVDSGGTPIAKELGGNSVYASILGNLLGSGGSVYLSGLAASAHTVKLQIYTPDGACTFWCRANTQAPAEGLAIQVIEH